MEIKAPRLLPGMVREKVLCVLSSALRKYMLYNVHRRHNGLQRSLFYFIAHLHYERVATVVPFGWFVFDRARVCGGQRTLYCNLALLPT